MRRSVLKTPAPAIHPMDLTLAIRRRSGPRFGLEIYAVVVKLS